MPKCKQTGPHVPDAMMMTMKLVMTMIMLLLLMMMMRIGVYQRLLVIMTFSGIEGGLRVMDHTHICRTRVSTNHLESQIDFLPFDVFTKQSIRIH